MKTEMRFVLTVCDGLQRGYCLEVDELDAGLALLTTASHRGMTAWLRDQEEDVLVGGSECCLDGDYCTREFHCEFVDVEENEQRNGAFWFDFLNV